MGGFEQMSAAIEERMRDDPELAGRVSRNIAFLLKENHVQEASEAEIRRAMTERAAVPLARGQVITAQTFFWGYHFVVPEAALQELLRAGDVTAAFLTLGGAAIAASGGALAPAVGLVAAYVAAELVVIRAIDRGNGVYLSAAWVSPGFIVPTPI